MHLALLLDATGIYFGLKDLDAHRQALLRVVAAAGDVDAAMSLASYRASRPDWTRPHFELEPVTARLEGVNHPLVREAIPNSIEIPCGRGVLVEGSNMSGKTTFLRTIGVNAVMAQTLNTCLAREYRAPVFDVRSCIGHTDDLLAGKSYHLAEIETLLSLVRASENPTPHLFLLDELFRGTNAVERVAHPRARARRDAATVRCLPFRRHGRTAGSRVRPPAAARPGDERRTATP